MWWDRGLAPSFGLLVTLPELRRRSWLGAMGWAGSCILGIYFSLAKLIPSYFWRTPRIP